MSDTNVKMLSAEHMDRLRMFAGKMDKFGAELTVFDPAGNCLTDSVPREGLPEGHTEQLAEYARTTYQSGEQGVCHCVGNGRFLATCLQENDETVAVAVLDADVAPGDTAYLMEMLDSLTDEFKSTSKAASQLEKVSTELLQTYEELVLLYNMSTNMKVTQSNAIYLQMACDQLTQLVNVEGIAIFLERTENGQQALALTAGSGVVSIDNMTADVLQVRLGQELDAGKEALLDSQVDAPFKYDWPERIENLIAVPLSGNGRMFGLMVATNVVEKPDFDSTDIK
ncbi:MAG: GAF domain-containing protein, partial [Planctomycetes bacterium]|nr:GAF domain-containing protein [Planctomycetota bacterium]